MAVYNQIDKEEHEKEFTSFCEQLLFRPFSEVQLYTGSCFELPIIYFIKNVTDVDNIIYNRNECAITKDATAPKCFNGTVLTIQSEGSHLGYARLYFKNNNVPYTFVKVPEARPAYMHPLLQIADFTPHNIILEQSDFLTDLFSDSGYTSKWISYFPLLTRDLVDAIWCPNWPEEANEWKFRQRPNEWPSPSTVKKIINNGCLLVAKPYQECQFIANEWRFSFSDAELMLVYTWNDRQIYVYHILRLIKSDVVRRCGGKKMTFLTTYHFKTLMFWACEEKPKDFWLPDNIETSVKELLIIMIEWLMEKQCRNYFIPGNNMLDHLPDSHDFEREVQFLIDSVKVVDQYISSTVSFTEDPKHDLRKEFSVRIPTNLLFAMHLNTSLSNIVDLYSPERHMYMPSNAVEKSPQFQSDINILFQCLTIHRSLILANKLEVKLNGLQEIKKCFQMANKNQVDGFTHVDISPMDNLHAIFTKLLMKNIDSSDNIESPKDNHQQAKSSHLPRNSTRRELCYSRTELIQICRALRISELFFLNAQIPKPSCFHTAAHEANFYWTIFGEERNDMAVESYKQALEICDRWLSYAKTINLSLTSIMFFGIRGLPIIISNRWSVIFDKYIQVVFGFLCLVKGVKNRRFQSNYKLLKGSNDLDVFFHVCAIDFLGYIRYQCKFHLRKWFLLDDSFTDDMQNHISRMFLYTAARISRPYRD